jgi:hypothetical protein
VAEKLSLEPTRAQIGKDELNIAEWPNGLLSKRPSKNVKTRVFEDKFGDMKRTVTITGSDKYGFPGYKEDEVLFGLVNVTREKNALTDRTVRFKRSELVRTLGWPDKGKSWRDVAQALNVIAGTLFVYENAWYEKGSTKKKFVNRKFHMLDHVDLVSENVEGAEYTITWGQVIFESFQCGSIKSIDPDFWRGLKSPVAKRLFRFLDKQFWNSNTLRYDLVLLGVHKLGMTENAHVGKLKRGIASGIRELEEKKYLVTVPLRERFRKISVGNHEVVFTREAAANKNERKPLAGNGAQKLIERGVAKARAEEIAGARALEEIDAAIREFEEKQKKGYFGARGSNPGGWLYKRLRDGVAKQHVGPPPCDLASLEALGRSRKREERMTREKQTREAKAEEDSRKQTVEHFLAGLTPEEAEEFVLSAGEAQRFIGRDDLVASIREPSKRGPLWYLMLWRYLEAKKAEKSGAAEMRA